MGAEAAAASRIARQQTRAGVSQTLAGKVVVEEVEIEVGPAQAVNVSQIENMDITLKNVVENYLIAAKQLE